MLQEALILMCMFFMFDMASWTQHEVLLLSEYVGNAISRLRNAIHIFLQQEHPQLLGQLSELLLCPRCLEKGGGKLRKPGSFSGAELENARAKGTIRVCFHFGFASWGSVGIVGCIILSLLNPCCAVQAMSQKADSELCGAIAAPTRRRRFLGFPCGLCVHIAIAMSVPVVDHRFS